MRAAEQSATQRDPLTLPAGELVDSSVEQILYAEHAGHFGQMQATQMFRGAFVAVEQVFQHGQVRQQTVFLEDQTDASFVQGHELAARLPVLITEAHGCTLHAFQTGDKSQQAGLAAAGASEQSGHTGQRDFMVHFEPEVLAVAQVRTNLQLHILAT